jgi:hypothetical protein
MKIHEINERSDGKFLCVFTFSPQPNAFGGFYPCKVYRKIVTAEKLAEYRELERKTSDDKSSA